MFVPPSSTSNNPLLRRTGSRPLILGELLPEIDERTLLFGMSDPVHMKIGSTPKSVTPSLSFGVQIWDRCKGLLFLLWVFCCCKVATDSVLRMDANLRNNFFYEAFLYYNPLFLVAVMVWLWGINVWVFLHSRVNYTKVFELEHNHVAHSQIWKIASWMTAIVLTSMTLYLYLYSHGEVSLAASQPPAPLKSAPSCYPKRNVSVDERIALEKVLLYSILPLLTVLPFDIFYLSTRIYFLRTLLRLTFPLQPITFADFFLADVLTSMAKVLSDLERAACRMFHGQVATISWFDPDSTCGSHSVMIPLVLAFPYGCRYLQCLRQYSDTKERACLWNALKYATAFPVILLSALKYHVLPEHWVGIYRPLWLMSSVLNSCFSFYWDLARDWDLSCFAGYSKSKFIFLRTNLLYNRRWVYYFAIVTNFFLRLVWTYKLSAHLRHNYITVFFMTTLEMLRRFQWNFFRIENEWNKISMRSNSQVSLKDMSTDTEKLLGEAPDRDVFKYGHKKRFR